MTVLGRPHSKAASDAGTRTPVEHLSTNNAYHWVRLAGGFAVGVDGREVHVPPGVQRLLAYLALARRSVSRTQCAAELWEFDTHERAISNLRTSLWRLNRACGSLVLREQEHLGLSDDVEVEIGEPRNLYRRLVQADERHDAASITSIVTEVALLPSWGDTWIVVEREQLRLHWLHALENAASQLAVHRPGVALLAAMAAVRIEPLQESAWRIVISINLRQGNVANAHKAYLAYRSMLEHELGVEPSRLMEQLIASSSPWVPAQRSKAHLRR